MKRFPLGRRPAHGFAAFAGGPAAAAGVAAPAPERAAAFEAPASFPNPINVSNGGANTSPAVIAASSNNGATLGWTVNNNNDLELDSNSALMGPFPAAQNLELEHGQGRQRPREARFARPHPRALVSRL